MYGSHHLHIPHRHRVNRLRLAAATALVVPMALLTPGVAQARPVVGTPPGGSVLRPGTLIDLAPGARDIQVDESSGGGWVAVSWSVRNSTGRDEVWARVKRGKTWGSKVRVSDPAVSATRSTMDLDSDGSLLLAWAEQRGSSRSLVARRLSGSSVGARKVFQVTATDGPYVAAGPLHDVVAWTASSAGTVRPFASVDTGAGFPGGVAVSGSGWRHPVIDKTLAVNADGQQVHVTYLSKDSGANKTRASWSVLETTRTTAWASWDGLGPTQKLAAPLRPMIAVDNRNVAALVFYNVSEQDQVRYPSHFLYDPKPSGSARNRLSDPRSLAVVDAEDSGPRTLESVSNRRGVLVAAYSTNDGQPARLKQITNPDAADPLLRDWWADALCSPRPEWFFTWQEGDAEIHCLDDESSPGKVEIWNNSSSPAVSTISPDSTLAGSKLKGTVPDPLISAIVITEDLATTTNDPVWLLDHTAGGYDAPPTLLTMSRSKAPSITGTARVGKRLTAQVGSWRPGPSRVTYRWYAGKKAIKGATQSSLKLTKKLKGKRISLRLQLSRSGYKDVAVATVATKKIKLKPKKGKKRKK